MLLYGSRLNLLTPITLKMDEEKETQEKEKPKKGKLRGDPIATAEEGFTVSND